MDSIASYYRQINTGFLNKNWDQGFDIFYKVDKGDDEPQFLKFAEYNPDNHARIQDLMNTESGQLYYIHETDLIKYYKRFLIRNLSEQHEKGEDALVLLGNAYNVATQILREYFENIGSPRVLRTLDDVLDIITICLDQGNLNFIDIFNATDKGHQTATHCVNVGVYCLTLGTRLKMKPQAVRELGLGGMLFDIGKKSIPDHVLAKKGELTPEEFKEVRKHPSAGKKVLNDMKCYSQTILQMSSQHHEKFNGEGYPLGVAGESINLFARVCAVMDVFDALICARHHHDPLTPFEALTKMKTEMPGHFDERILVNFIKVLAAKQPA